MMNGSAAPAARPDRRAYSREHDDLRQINPKDVAGGGAQRLERGDDVAAAIDMAFDGIGDADPPTRSAARPTSVRNWVKRLMVRSNCGEALRGYESPSPLRATSFVHRRPARSRRDRWRCCPAISPVVPAHQAAGLQQFGARSPATLTRKRGPKTKAAGELSGSDPTTLRI